MEEMQDWGNLASTTVAAGWILTAHAVMATAGYQLAVIVPLA